MKKNILKNKKIMMTSGALLASLAVLGGVAYYSSANKFAATTETKVESRAVDTTTQKNDSSGTTTPASDGAGATATTNTTPQTVTYEITGVNKNNGDVFSLPDRIAFTISPAVDSARARLLFQDGSSLYDKTVSGSSADLTVYPAKKLQAGTTGTIVIEGTKGDKVVVTKEIKVVF